jgi:orotate phosphoribosyltransferase
MSPETSLPALIEHLRRHSLRTDGPFTLRSGAISSWYLDARQTSYDGWGAILVGSALLEVLDESVEAIGGMTMGADPVALATAMVAADRGRPLRAFSVRKEAKGHGAAGRLVGPVRAGDRVAVCDDTVTTGGAVFEAIDALEDAGAEVRQVVVLVDRSAGVLEQRCRERNLLFATVLRAADLGVE